MTPILIGLAPFLLAALLAWVVERWLDPCDCGCRRYERVTGRG